MPPRHRKSAMRVKDGRVQKKNNWALDQSDYFALPQAEIRIDRPSPGFGRHLVTVAQLRAFLDLLPEWDEVAIGLNAILIDAHQWDTMGWHNPGVVAICAWEPELWWTDTYPHFIDEHADLLELLEVEQGMGDEGIELRWTENQARAFQLLHILPHELGHHHDRMTTRSQRDIARGEPYAEAYANRVLDEVWPRYIERFAI